MNNNTKINELATAIVKKRKEKIDSIISQPFKINKRFFRILGIIFYVLLHCYCYYNLTYNSDSYVECGTLIKKFERGVYNSKYGHRTDLEKVFVVKFPNNIEEIIVTTDTYYKSSLNDKVCFKKSKTTFNSVFVGIITILLFLSYIVIAVILLFILSEYSRDVLFVKFKNMWNKLPKK